MERMDGVSVHVQDFEMSNHSKLISNHFIDIHVTSSVTTEKLSIDPYLPMINGSNGENSKSLYNNNIPRLERKQNKEVKICSMPSSRHSSCPMLVMAPPANPKASVTLEKAIEYEQKYGRRKLDPNIDKKKLRRTVSNRLSAQRSRAKKAEYILHMEKLVENLQEMISVLSPQIRGCKEKRELLMLENDSLKKEVEKCSIESNVSELELERKKLEVHMLKELEKVAKSRDHYSNPGLKYDQDTSFKQLSDQPYPTLSHYQYGFHNNYGSSYRQPSSTMISWDLKMASSSSFKHSAKDMLSLSRMKQPDEVLKLEKNQEETDIDQYLNFDEVSGGPSNI